MTFRPESLRGSAAPGVVDYRLARQSVLSEFRKGRLARNDVCDAHPELVRAARLASQPSSQDCPVCEEDKVAFVTYAFGSQLPAHGRCVTTAKEMAKLSRRRSAVTCYVVEVCPSCSWNHLARVFNVGGS